MRTRWHTLIVALLLTISGLALMPTVGHAQNLDVEGYREVLHLALDAVSGSDPAPDTALALLERVEQVTLDDGMTLTPPLDPIISALRANPPDIESAREQLTSLVGALELIEGSQLVSDEAQASLDRILARDEFAVQESTERDPGIVQRIIDPIAQRLDRILRPIVDWLAPFFGGGGSAAPSTAQAILGLLGVVATVAIIIAVVRAVRRSLTTDTVHLDEHADLPPSSADARAEAERLFQEGNIRAALRSLYIATLLRLEEAGRLRFDRSLTNLEVLNGARVHGDTRLLDWLSPLVDRFDRVWYGGRPCSVDDYHDFARLAERAWEGEV